MPTVENDDDLPPPGLAVSAELLTSVFADDHDAVLKLRDLEDIDWWNVALSFAQLMKGIFSGEPSALKVLAGTFEDAQRLRDSADQMKANGKSVHALAKAFVCK